MTLRVVELFAGIGAQAQALENLGLDFTSTVCEIDEKAYKSYCAIHGDTPNIGDIIKVEHLPECDLLTYSYPCTSLSIAGKQEGMVEGSGTASSLVWEVGRLLDDASERESLPEVLLMENVDAVLNELNIAEFRRWLAKLTSLGYTSSYKVLNAKDYGVPQNRKRIFVVSMLGGRMLDFPKPCPDGRVLRDVLEDDVPEQYYLSEDKIAKYRAHEERQRENATGFGWRPSEPCGISPAVLTSPAKSSTNTIIITGNIEDPSKYESVNRIYGTDGIAPSVTTCQDGGQVPKIEVIGTLGGYEKEGRVHNPDGLSPTLNLCRPDHAPKIEVIRHVEGYQGQSGRVHDAEGLAPTVVANRFGSPASLIEVKDNDTIPNLSEGEVVAMLTPGRINKRQNGPRCKTDGSSFTITCQDIHGIAENHDGRLRIRYLTPRECWRLMGFPDSAYEAARDVPTSKTQLYKQAGNSIAVPCLEAIFKAIYINRTWHERPSLEAFL